jgi:hypothetical protein
MPFSLHNLSRLIAYSHHQAVQPLGSTANHLIPFFKEHEYQLHEIQLYTLTKLLSVDP